MDQSTFRTPSILSDTQLLRRVTNALANLGPETRSVQAQVHNGIVTLRGRVADLGQKQRLGLAIRRVPGVFRLNLQNAVSVDSQTWTDRAASDPAGFSPPLLTA